MSAILEKLKNLNVRKNNQSVSPHKFALLLALAELYALDPHLENRFVLDDRLEALFIKFFKELAPHYNLSLAVPEFPFYHLQGDGFWSLCFKPGVEDQLAEVNRRVTKSRLQAVLNYAQFSPEFDDYLRHASQRQEFQQTIRGIFQQLESSTPIVNLASANFTCNPFVGYLNSLQRINGTNENALAETQACNEHFASIRVEHPLTQRILEELNQPGKRHVILTGHAGDGKTTIAVEVYKKLRHFSSDQPLKAYLQPREDLPESNITIFKDLSERHKQHDSDLIGELLEGNRRFLLVSNTGNLLDLLVQQAKRLNETSIECENQVLQAIGQSSGEAELRLGPVVFLVFNLAQLDNLELAHQILTKMTAAERWQACEACACRASCSIRQNAQLLRQERPAAQVFLAYRRMYEYGTRLTMRQLTEHLAYLITAGHSGREAAQRAQTRQGVRAGEDLFFNRFFGDDGWEVSASDQQMQALREIHKHGFGKNPCPSWERELWRDPGEQGFQLQRSEYEALFQNLRWQGMQTEILHPQLRLRGQKHKGSKFSPEQARVQVRRMIYFLYEFPPPHNEQKERVYLTQFLNSLQILRWQQWQKQEGKLSQEDESDINQKIFHVLQEFCTGVRLPEGSIKDERTLYVTLSRRRQEVRHSAQVVLAEVNWNDDSFSLELRGSPQAAAGTRYDLYLVGRNKLQGCDLFLSLPFLDYVVTRHFGEVGAALQASYLQRLERFKAQVQRQAKISREEIMLVRLRTDHRFRRQSYIISKNKLEVKG